MNETETKTATTIYFTAPEVAQILGVTKRTIYNLITSGRLDAVKVSSGWKISKEAIQAYIDYARTARPSLFRKY